jgi:CheY-specific phosphatase CheX
MPTIEFKDGKMPEVVTESVKDSITGIFSSIFGAQPKLHVDNNKKVGDSVLGIISYVGDVSWLLILILPRSCAEAVAMKFTGFAVDYDSPDMGDVVGELNNILAGDIVARLSSKGVKVGMSLPTIMRGHDVEPLLPRDLPSLKMSYTIPEGEIFIKLAGAKTGQPVGRRPGT